MKAGTLKLKQKELTTERMDGTRNKKYSLIGFFREVS